MDKKTIYCVHPISGMSADDVFEYYEGVQYALRSSYNVLTPMFGKESLRTALEFKSEGYKDNPLTTNHAIFTRDHWMVSQADIIYANLMGTDRVSIGSMMELAWASHMGRYVVLSMDKDNIHRHAFVLEAASVIYEDHDSAVDYLHVLADGEM
jgi:nucleoside 2-deoxyribosyltransferase